MTISLVAASDGLFATPIASDLEAALAGKNCVVVGPGIGVSEGTRSLVRALMSHCPIPLVVDADALNCLANDLPQLKNRPAPTVLTPHPGEMSRLAGIPVAAVQADRLGVARRFAKETGTCLVLKGARTVIASPDGTTVINLTGNAGMATGGMGDVLAGVIGALCAQGLPAEEAAILGVYVHGMAADLATVEQGGEIGLIASDVIRSLPRALATTHVHNNGASTPETSPPVHTTSVRRVV